MTIFNTIIPHENRREQMELRERLGLDGFLDHVWRERNKERRATLGAAQCRTKSKGVWPHVGDVDEARGNVLPIRKANP